MEKNELSAKKSRNYTILICIMLLILIASIIGVTYAFFNYTREGGSSTVKTGRIAFTYDYTPISLTDAYPITSTQARTDTKNAKVMNVSVTGDTDYSDGIEYLITAEDVHMTIGEGQDQRTVPLAIEVRVTDKVIDNVTRTLGTEETGNYFANRSSYTTSKYKVLYQGNLANNSRLLVGYIAPNTTPGTVEGVNGIIEIKAYFDTNSVVISDTYNGTDTTDFDHETPSYWIRGREVFTTSEWNSIQEEGHELSFKIKVESKQGKWVQQ